MAQNLYVEAPAVQPLPYGLLSAAVVVDETDPHAFLGVQYEPDYCGPSYATPGACRTAGETGVGPGVPVDGINLVEGIPFSVYHLLQCKAVGVESRIAARARTGLMGGEGRAVESVLAHQMAIDVASVDLTPTPGTAVHPVDGLGILEAWAGSNYGGAPTIHSPRNLTTLLGSYHTVSREGRGLETLQGSKVASGAGYVDWQGPGATTAGANKTWLYVTGTVMARRSPVIEVRPQITTNPADNIVQALAFRPYVLTRECITGAVLVNLPYKVPA